ncbi:hypothetical protein B0J17DRAFT_682611 [Rhizoctonia solani]|nr:hypothetical protein B0J17DRAFT_682611 [Rhizoctonia solani]
MTRAGETPLDVHIVDTSEGLHLDEATRVLLPPDSRFLDFLASIAPHTRSFTIRTNHAPTKRYFCDHVLSTFLTKCAPGGFKWLSVSVGRDYDFPEGSVHRTLLGQIENRVEALCHPVTVFRSREFYPAWKSKLYHGLVELCLTGEGLEASIPESRLAAVLKSSPGLRILKIALQVTRITPSHTPIEPVALVDLEQLKPESFEEPQLGYLLRLIAPGLKPLSITIANPWEDEDESWRPGAQFTSRTELEKFFARSNIAQLYTNGFNGYNQVADALVMAPSVRVLVLDAFACNQVPDENVLPQGFTLDELTSLTWSSVQRMVEKHCVRKLILWSYDFRYCG